MSETPSQQNSMLPTAPTPRGTASATPAPRPTSSTRKPILIVSSDDSENDSANSLNGKKKKKRSIRAEKFSELSMAGTFLNNKASGSSKNAKSRDSHPQQNQPKQENPKQDKPKQDRPKLDKPKQDKPKQDKPKQDKPKQDKPKSRGLQERTTLTLAQRENVISAEPSPTSSTHSKESTRSNITPNINDTSLDQPKSREVTGITKQSPPHSDSLPKADSTENSIAQKLLSSIVPSSSHELTPEQPSKTSKEPLHRSSTMSSITGSPTRMAKRRVSLSDILAPTPVYWARTPPLEAFKKLKRVPTSRSHEEEVASLKERLNQLPSASSHSPGKPKHMNDIILEMLGTSSGPNFESVNRAAAAAAAAAAAEEEDDVLDSQDPISPIKSLQNRMMSAARQQGFSRHNSAHELGMLGRRRHGRERMGFTKPVLSTPLHQISSSKESREDVMEMIKRVRSRLLPSSQTTKDTDTPPCPRFTSYLSDSSDTVVGGSSLSSDGGKATLVGTVECTSSGPSQVSSATAEPLSSEYDDFFTDLQMNDDDLEELTQLEQETVSSAFASSSAASQSSYSAHSSFQTPISGVRSQTITSATGGEAVEESSRLTVLTPEPLQGTPNQDSEARVAEDEFSDLEDFDDGFDFEEEPESKKDKYPIDNKKYRRMTVVEVLDEIDPRWPTQCKILNARSIGSTNLTKVFLCGSWSTSQVTPNDTFHLIEAFICSDSDMMINNNQGMVIIKPDTLVPTSMLSESFTCSRKPVVDMRARRTDQLTLPLLHGTMLHELFQYSLKSNDFSKSTMEAKADDIIHDHMSDLCLISEDIDSARKDLFGHIPSCQQWAWRYLRAAPWDEGRIDPPLGTAEGEDSRMLCVKKVVDIEENIWSPMFGLKGKIDATIQVTLTTSRNGVAQSKHLIVPFELKTGKKSNVISHRAQTTLYTLLMTDRYDTRVQWGLLFYLKTGEFFQIATPHDQIRAMLMQRNELAFYEEDKILLPPMLGSKQTCIRCFSFSTCTVFHKLLDAGTPETSGMGTAFEEATDHLNDNHAAFLEKWNRLLSLEQSDVIKFQKQIWTMHSSERQAAGNCLGNLVLVETNRAHTQPEGHVYRFALGVAPPLMSQQTLSQTLRGGRTLLSSNITVGDPIVLSSENEHYALAIGQVLDLSLADITVRLDRPLEGPPLRLPGFDHETNQSYRGLIEIKPTGTVAEPRTISRHAGELFRIDKDEMAAGFARARNNLVQLFRADIHGGDSKRRELVVDMRPPVFDRLEDVVLGKGDKDLNEDQQRAIKTVLAAQDYALILGMPGTGKTTTIAQIIHTLVGRGKTVLLTSYTHSAVDNVLMKLRPDIKTVRLGNKDKVHRSVQKLVPDFSRPPFDSSDAIHELYQSCQVVGTTSLGIGDPLFSEKRFDYCIIDEASQITTPICLGPLRYADVFVLVGDHNQLPPLVKNKGAKEGGYDQSLFKTLSNRHPEAVVSLTLQYRMNEDVMLLSNTLVYNNQLRCATEAVAKKRLEMPNMHLFRRRAHTPKNLPLPKGQESTKEVQSNDCHGGQSCWLEQVLDPERSVVFIDTDALASYEVQVMGSTQNPTEALLVMQLTEALISGGIAEENIGVISVLRAQLKILSRLLRQRPLLDIHTVDRYQGKDKECVIVSLVRSNADQNVGDLLRDWRRINVAFTRAKRKFVIFGSQKTLQGSNVFRKFIKLMEQKRWILRPEQGTEHHHSGLHPASVVTVGQSGKARVRGEGLEDEEDSKENIRPSLDPDRVNGKQVGGGSTLREPKVIRAEANVVLKQYPHVKNIMDGL